MAFNPGEANAKPGSTGSMATALMTASGQEEKQNIASAYESQKNRDFQERMSDTAHQRQIADLKKAGINPILTGKYGGSSTPSGSTASMAGGDIAKTASSISSAVSQARLTTAQVNNVNANTEKTGAETTQVIQETEAQNTRNPEILQNLIQDKKLKLQQESTSAVQAKKLTQEIKNLEEEYKKLFITRIPYDLFGNWYKKFKSKKTPGNYPAKDYKKPQTFKWGRTQ